MLNNYALDMPTTKKKHRSPSHMVYREPPLPLYDEDVEAKKVVESHYKKIMGREYAYSKVRRILLREAAERIKEQNAKEVE